MIKEIQVYIDQNRVVNRSQVGLWDYVVSQLDLNKEWIYVEYIDPGAVIRPEQEIWFVSTDTKAIPQKEKDIFLETISRLSFLVMYESIYGESNQIGINVRDAQTPWDRISKKKKPKKHRLVRN